MSLAEARRAEAPLPAPAGAPSWTLGDLATALVERHLRLRYHPARRRFLLEGERGAAGFPEHLDELLRELRLRCAAAAQAAELPVDAATLAQHHARFFAEDAQRYAINRADAALDADTPGDTLSLRQYRSQLFFPANFLLRAELTRPEEALAFAISLRLAAEKLAARAAAPPRRERDARPAAEREAAARAAEELRQLAAQIGEPDDPRLARLLEEQLIHNVMAHRALLRQKRCRGGDIFIRITDLPEEVLADLYASLFADGEGDPRALIHERAFMSTALTAAGANMYSRRNKPFKLVVRALGVGSTGRHLDGSVEGIWSGEEEVVFAPGTAFRVTRCEEGVASDRTADGQPRTYLFLQEVSAAAAAARARRPPTAAAPAQLFLHGACGELPDLLRKAAADVVCTVGAARIPVVVLSRSACWDPTAQALRAASGHAPPPPPPDASLDRFRLTIPGAPRLLSWPELVATFELSAEEARHLERTAQRAEGSLRDCWFSLEPVERTCWSRLELWRAESDEWLEIELPAVLPHAPSARQGKPAAPSDAPDAPDPPPLDLLALSREVQAVLDSSYKQPFPETYAHPRTGAPTAVTYSPLVEPLRREVPRWTHGAMHAARATLWGLLLSELYRHHTGQREPQLHRLLLAITHHDCARQDEGTDYWDAASGERYAAYLEARGERDAAARAYFADAIAHKERRNTAARQLVQAADCLDILRVSMFLGPLRIQRGWEPRGAFNTDRFDLYRVLCDAEGKPSADALLHELHHFIRLTEIPEARVWFETCATDLLLELLGAVAHVDHRHRCYPALRRWLAPFLARMPAGFPSAAAAELLDRYFPRITRRHPEPGEPAARLPVQIDDAVEWDALWDRARWRPR